MALAMLLPALDDLQSGNRDWLVFTESAVTVFMVSSLIIAATRGAKEQFTARLGFLLTTGLWATGCLLGALPLYYSHLPISFAAAVFESASGITTTGSSVLTGLDTMPRGILLWRSLLCWIGGVGFVGVALLLLPSLRVGGVKLFTTESSSASEKVLPRVHQVANAILLSYMVLSISCVLCYFLAGMSLFDAVNNAMTTVSTAGFSTHDASFGYYAGRPMILVVGTVFMLLSSLPFIFYIKAALPGRRGHLAEPQVVVFLLIVLVSGLALGFHLQGNTHESYFTALPAAFFNFASAISSTGFESEDFTAWGPMAYALFFLAFFIGGCSGSTAGGIKVNRLIILWRLAAAKLTMLFSPHRIIKIRYGGQEVTDNAIQSILLFICLYFICFLIGSALLLLIGLDFTTALTGAVSSLSNIGLSFGAIIGPGGSFGHMPDSALWVFSFLMMAGRLEIITVCVLFVPAFWRR